MQKKEFFGFLLLVSLVSTIVFAGVTWSTGGPTITVSPNAGTSDTELHVSGAGWAPGLPVIIYWDLQAWNHTIGNVTASSRGSFAFTDRLEVANTFIGPHSIIAVQGASTARAQFTVTAANPPDDRILAPIQQLEDKLDNTTSGLPGIQSNFTTVLNNIADIEGKLDNKTSGLPGIQSNLTNIDSDVNAVEGKLDPSGRLGNTTQMSSKTGYYSVTGKSGSIITCEASKTAEFTVTFVARSDVSGANVTLELYDGMGSWWDFSDVVVSWNGYSYYVSATFTVAAKGVSLSWHSGAAFFNTLWFITVQAPPDTTITFS